MKAFVRTQYGKAETLQWKEIEKPTPSDNGLLIRVHHTTINRTDCSVLTGKPFVMRFFIGLMKPSSPIPGTDFAGEILEIGKDVKDFKVGDRVWGFNDEGLASHTQIMTIQADQAIAIIPDGISYSQAVASAEGAHYAYNIINSVQPKKGDKVLVNGATGGIGSAAIQILKAMGTYVTAVANTKNMDLIKSLGVDKIYNYEVEDFTEIDDEKYHFVLDAVGKSNFGKCKNLLLPKGVYISSELGPNAENPFLAIRSKFYGKKKVLFPIPSNIKKSMEFIISLIEQEKFKPVIDRTYPLEKIAEAFQYVETGQKTGNVVIEVAK